jgi:hypothetical protein
MNYNSDNMKVEYAIQQMSVLQEVENRKLLR